MGQTKLSKLNFGKKANIGQIIRSRLCYHSIFNDVCSGLEMILNTSDIEMAKYQI
jgi:hypothetical protein